MLNEQAHRLDMGDLLVVVSEMLFLLFARAIVWSTL